MHMKEREAWEEKIKNVLALECDGITASRDLKDRIDRQILESQKEAGNMKKFSMKKLVIGVVAGCLLVSGGVFAAGHVVSLTSHSYLWDAYRSYGDMDKAQAELGYSADTVEEFSNGYRFDKMFVNDVNGTDEVGNVIYTFKDLNISYEKSGEPPVWLDVNKPVEQQIRKGEPEATRQVEGITLYYDTTTYKFVPPSYELTEEDQANMERDDFTISYGTDEVQVQQNSAVTWEKEGVHYNLSGFDLNLNADEMFDMAEEVMGTK